MTKSAGANTPGSRNSVSRAVSESQASDNLSMRQPIITLALLLVVASSVADDARPVDVVFKAECDATEQRYVLLLPNGSKPDESHDVLIALHGHGSDRWQFVRDPRDECKAARDVAAKHRMIYVSPDYRAKTSWMGPKAEADLVQIVANLKQRHRDTRIFVTGGSMGGTAALTFAALHPELVSGVAAMNGTANLLEYAQFQEAIATSFGGTKVDIPDEYKKRSAEYWPERLTMPIGITTGGQDALVPPHSVERLAAVLKQLNRPVLLIRRDNTGHQTNYEDGVAILEFMIAQAKPVGAK